MDQNILLSKVVANPTDTTWAQAYSTLNLYIVLSIRSEDAEAGIVTSGKELLEKIQREYFSLDDKNITNIKADDIVVLETGGFSKKVPLNKLSGILDDREVSEIS